MATTTYTFDDLPLVIDGGIGAAHINGQAEVIYSSDGGWAISNITLEGFGQRNVATGRREWPQVQAPASIAQIVRTRLHNEWHSKVQDAVNQQIDEDREAHRAGEYDRRRDDVALESLT